MTHLAATGLSQRATKPILEFASHLWPKLVDPTETVLAAANVAAMAAGNIRVTHTDAGDHVLWHSHNTAHS